MIWRRQTAASRNLCSLLAQDEEKASLWRGELDELLPELEMGRESELELSLERLAQAEQAMQRWQQEWMILTNRPMHRVSRLKYNNHGCCILKITRTDE